MLGRPRPGHRPRTRPRSHAHAGHGLRHTRQHIRRAIEDEGWNPQLGAFTQAFGSSELDASALMLPLVGFLPGDDPRIRTTVAAIASKLTDARGHVRRYLRDDFASEEGAFLLCTFWLAHALALIDEVPRAREVFETALSCANEVGLLADHRGGAGQLSAGVQSYRPDQRGTRHRPCRTGTAEQLTSGHAGCSSPDRAGCSG
ncbi:glycoside hydrolase family 15 protein [Streptomyces anulatus]